jgi:hypothetical protein
MGGMGNVHKTLVGNLEGKRRLGRSTCRWEYIITDHLKRGWEAVNWMRLVQDRDQGCVLVNTGMKLRIP